MSRLVQIAQAREPDLGARRLMEGECNVYHCQERCAAVIEAGGGSETAVSRSSLRLCADHARKVRDDLSTVLERAEAPEGEPC